MTRILRVSLPNIKGFARVYEVNETDSLYHFHKKMMSDMEFPQDQMVLFKALDEKENVVARYATFDLGQGSIEHISIARTIKEGAVKFIYFYDTTNKKSVIITIEGEGIGNVDKPTLLENLSKGPNPEAFLNGYVAFEDLPPEKQRHPDDDGFTDDEDDDKDGEDEEDIISDEEDTEENED